MTQDTPVNPEEVVPNSQELETSPPVQASETTEQVTATPPDIPQEPSVSIEVQAPAQPVEPSPQPVSPAPAQEMKPDFRLAVREGKKKKYEARLEKVLSLAREKGKITNDDIQKSSRVSDATATRYARTLISRGQLKRSGKTKSSFYELP